MEFGIQLGNLDWQRLKDVAQAAEALGFGSIMLADHIVHEGPERNFDPHALSYEALVRAAVLVEATSTAEIGHLVLCNLFRHPVITAQALMSLDRLSGGRVFLGIGTGWTEREFQMTGIPFPEIGARLRMLDEALTIMRSLFTQETTTFAGEFYQLRDAILWPKPLRAPLPVLLGGGGNGLLRLAAKHADVLNIIAPPGKAGYIPLDELAKLTDQAFHDKLRFVRGEAARQGRRADALRISNVMFTAIVTNSPAESRAAAEGMAGFFRLPPEAISRSPMALIGTPEECIAELQRRARTWEVSQFVFAFSDEGVMRRLGEEILPHVAA